jgi:thiamine pyrophosphate-dependent acetolactate synthase large subunit-like protein
MADKTRDPAVIEREIERTREELARSIDLLAERLNPKNVAQRGVVKAKAEAGRVAEDIGAMVRNDGQERRRSPLTGPVLLGTGLMVSVVAVRLLVRRRRV